MDHVVEIEKGVFGGMGLARLDGKVVFVQHALPGETAKVRIVEQKKDYTFAEVTAIEKISPNRIEPQCGHFGICGGCDYLNCDYTTELNIKKGIIRDTLERQANIQLDAQPEIEIIKGERFGYRSHATIKIQNKKRGFFRKNTNELVPFPEQGCLLLDERLRDYIASSDCFQEPETRVAVDRNGMLFDSSDPGQLMHECENDMVYERSIDCFYQGNRYLRSRMLDVVKTYCLDENNNHYLDICCGIGFFTLYLASLGKQVSGFDISKDNIIFAGRNAMLNNLTERVSFKKLASSMINPHIFNDVNVIVDPPRAGIDKKTRMMLSTLLPEKMVYCSCNPSTFARDCRDFLKAGYSLNKLTLIDMFPGTHHIEIIAQLIL